MYYKIVKNDKVIDVLDNLQYVVYQRKHDMLLSCRESEAQGILSADETTAYHVDGMFKFNTDKYPTVTLEEITEDEYKQLKAFSGSTPEEIIDNYTSYLIEEGLL